MPMVIIRVISKHLLDRIDEILSRNGYELGKLKDIVQQVGYYLIMVVSSFIFLVKEDRLFYDLERIWSDGKEIDVQALIDQA